MRFDPWKCPECGKPARGTHEMVPGLALLNFAPDGEAEYEGETKMYWDGQTTDTDDAGKVLLECPEGHQWPADITDVPEWKQLQGEANG